MKFTLPKNIKIPKIDLTRLKEFSQKIFQDRFEKELKDLLQLETENPNDMRVKQKIAELYFRQGNIDEAVQHFEEMGDYFEKQEFVLKAIKAYKNVLKIKPVLVDINLKLAGLFIKVDMSAEAANQYRIAINFFAAQGNSEKTVHLSEQLVKMDPSNSNRGKLAEIYQSYGLIDQAIKQFETLAKDYRNRKMYDKLLSIYERILPHRPDNPAILKDMCILYLRQQKPERALKIIDQYNKDPDDASIEDLVKKSKLMLDALKRQRKAG